MYINNVDDLVEALKPRLKDYLAFHLGSEVNKKAFKCFIHDDATPSMSFNPKSGNTVCHCFGCGATIDIFAAANHFEGLPANGVPWISETLPTLAEKFGLQIQLSELSQAERERPRNFKLASDIATILGHPNQSAQAYCTTRGWSGEHLVIGQIDRTILLQNLSSMGWGPQELAEIPTNLFAANATTFAIKDYRSRVTGFVTRFPDGKPKYINSPESSIYKKRETLLGIDTVVKNKFNRVYAVEGPGDLASLHRVGILNAVASCGTAFTSEHLSLLKMLGIRTIDFCLDWDDAGQSAIYKILSEELRQTIGITCNVIAAPASGEKDPGEYLLSRQAKDFTDLRVLSGFEWMLDQSKASSPEDLCSEMIPIIASEQTSVRREVLIRTLAQKTDIYQDAIRSDVDAIRDSKTARKHDRIKAAVERYQKELQTDPENAITLLSRHQEDLEQIDTEFNKKVGIDYQLDRFDAIQLDRLRTDGVSRTEFKFGYYTFWGEAFSGGLSSTEGALFYFGGRANSGKTATVSALGLDVAIHDPDAVVLMHYTDDSYIQVEPRQKTNIARMIALPNEPSLTIGMAANPYRNITTQKEWDVYHRATGIYRELIEKEKLWLIDSEDGANLTALERCLKTIRRRHPDKKILVVSDKCIVTFH